jgi:hypothetical protein
VKISLFLTTDLTDSFYPVFVCVVRG